MVLTPRPRAGLAVDAETMSVVRRGSWYFADAEPMQIGTTDMTGKKSSPDGVPVLVVLATGLDYSVAADD